MPYGGESSTSDGHEERCFNIVAKPIDSAVLVARNRLLERAVGFEDRREARVIDWHKVHL